MFTGQCSRLLGTNIKPGFCKWKDIMKRTVIAAVTLCWGAISMGSILMGAISSAQASPGNQGLACVARVLHSEELPYAPIGYWLASVTLEVTPSNGPPFIKT